MDEGRSAAPGPRSPGAVRVLLVEDEPSISEPFAQALRRAGFQTTVAATGAEVLVEDIEEVRLAAAKRMGATRAVNPETESGEAGSIDEDGLDLVLDACGEEQARQEALDLCRPGGTVVLLGMARERSEVDFGASIRKERRVQMSFGYTAADFRCSLDLLVAGEIDLTEWTAEMPLEEGQKAFERMTEARGDTLKMMLRVR